MKSIIKIFLIVMLLFYGCDLFSTRTAEIPNQGGTSYQPPLDYKDLITNLKNSVREKNVQNYLATFADSLFSDKKFEFVPSSGASLQFPSLADNWSRSDEEQYFNNIKSNSLNLILSNENYSPQGDSVIYTASYILDVSFDDPSIPNTYQGDLRFNMVRDSRSIWVIYLWQDIKSGENPSWSELKGRFH